MAGLECSKKQHITTGPKLYRRAIIIIVYAYKY